MNVNEVYVNDVRPGRVTCGRSTGKYGISGKVLLTDARRSARVGENGEAIPLAEQDRSKWDQNKITEGTQLLTKALSKGHVGPYQIQAAIAAIHDEAVRAEDTDWPQILALYGLLTRMSDNPMVTLNYVFAKAMVHGSEEGLKILKTLDTDKRLANNYRLDVVRAHLFAMKGDTEAAITYYRSAVEKTISIPAKKLPD